MGNSTSFSTTSSYVTAVDMECCDAYTILPTPLQFPRRQSSSWDRLILLPSMRIFYRHGGTLLPILSSQTNTVPHIFHGAGDLLATAHKPIFTKVECVRLLFIRRCPH
jgi:hypothetical protein